MTTYRTVTVTLALFLASTLPGTAGVAQQTFATPQQQHAKPPKKRDRPIDPDATAGVRGGDYSITIHVLRKGKPSAGASVLAKDIDGHVAGTCTTTASGQCAFQIAPGDYVVSATHGAFSAESKLHMIKNPQSMVMSLESQNSSVP